MSGQRRVETDNPGGLPLVDPGAEGIRIALTQAAEIEDFERHPAPRTQAADPFQRLDVIIERWPDENSYADIGPSCGLPIKEAMDEPLEARKRERAALSRFRDQAIPADMGARGMAQRERQSSGLDLSRHGAFLSSFDGRNRRMCGLHLQSVNLAAYALGKVDHLRLLVIYY